MEAANMQQEQAAWFQLRKVEQHCFLGNQVHRDRVSAEGVHDQHIEAPILLPGELAACITQDNRGLCRRLAKDFIAEASRWYADTFAHVTPAIANLVNLYALASRMRVLSSLRIIESADRVIRVIIETYLVPNKTFHDVKDILDKEAMNPLHEFSNACREELQQRGTS